MPRVHCLYAFCPYPQHSLLKQPRSLLSLSGASGFGETVSTDIQTRPTMVFQISWAFISLCIPLFPLFLEQLSLLDFPHEESFPRHPIKLCSLSPKTGFYWWRQTIPVSWVQIGQKHQSLRSEWNSREDGSGLIRALQLRGRAAYGFIMKLHSTVENVQETSLTAQF